MIIKKVSEEITRQTISKLITLEIDGKQVRVYTFDRQDDFGTDADQDVDAEDKAKLTEEQAETLADELYTALDLKEGENYDTEVNSEEHNQRVKEQINQAKFGK